MSLRFFKAFFFAILLLSQSCSAREAPSCSVVLSEIQNLPHCGVLRVSKGFVYVDLDDAYIHELALLLQEEGFEEPPYFGNPDLVGAHISVIFPDELKRKGIENIEECGEIICFVPKECKVVSPPRWEGVEEVYLIVVEAPQLNEIREKYGLPKSPYDFHITVGVKPKKEKVALLNR